MANPRQRRKARSGSHTAVHHSRRAKKLLKKQAPIRGPKVLQDAWDKEKTVRQNYDALGLLACLNPTESGGVERPRRNGVNGHSGSHEHSIVPRAGVAGDCSSSSQKEGDNKNSLPKGYGRIIRDENGDIVDVEMGEGEDGDDEVVMGDVGETFHNDVASAATEEKLGEWVTLGGRSDARTLDASGRHVVHRLEELSKEGGTGRARFTSAGERGELQRLVMKYGDDVEGMARDRKMNVDQRTSGQLRRAIAKAGGMEELRKKT